MFADLPKGSGIAILKVLQEVEILDEMKSKPHRL